jgi:hypothetical protein
MTIKTHFFVEDRLVKLEDMVENYMSDNRIGIEDILKIDHSRFVNSNGDIITTIMLVYKKEEE